MAIANQVMKPAGDLEISINTYNVLKETLYPGAKDQSISMVLNYCKARKIDPLLKPVHLVPMNVKSGRKDGNGKDIYEWRDVVMPGIGLYRIDASRSGQYAGMSEPEFGDDITEQVGSVRMTYPKWCKVTVKKLIPSPQGTIVAEFTAKEYWKENYASKKRDDNSPNAMWEKRAYGQLAKCAEAQALRKAFPDVVGNDYTKEEMEGKHFQETIAEIPAKVVTGEVIHDAKLYEDFKDLMMAIEKSETEEQLRAVFDEIKKFNFKSHQDLFKQLIYAKDLRKSAISVKEFNQEIDKETGEVIA